MATKQQVKPGTRTLIKRFEHTIKAYNESFIADEAVIRDHTVEAHERAIAANTEYVKAFTLLVSAVIRYTGGKLAHKETSDIFFSHLNEGAEAMVAAIEQAA